MRRSDWEQGYSEWDAQRKQGDVEHRIGDLQAVWVRGWVLFVWYVFLFPLAACLQVAEVLWSGEFRHARGRKQIDW